MILRRDCRRSNATDTQTLMSILLPRRYEVHSWTRCLVYYSIYLEILVILMASYALGVNWPGFINDYVNHSDIFFLALLLYTYEPIKLMIAMAVTPAYTIPNKNRVLPSIEANQSLGFLIPCHHSEDVILETVRSCLRHVKQEQIFILDNGKSEYPSDNTGALLKRYFPNVNYIYIPIPSKTKALRYGAEFAQEKYPFVFLIDDDVRVPAEFIFKKYVFDSDPYLKGLVLPLRAIAEYQPGTFLSRLITSWQDLEYQLADLDIRFQDMFAAVARPHGGGSIWRTEALIEVLNKHNTKFPGEDEQMGFNLQHMQLGGQAILRYDPDNYLSTFVPVTYLGPANKGNLWNQRVRSWSPAQYTSFWTLVAKPLLTIWSRPERGICSLIMVKETQIYKLYTQLTHVLRFPLMLFATDNSQYWALMASFIVIQALTSMMFNYLKLPPHLRNDMVTAITYPIYKGIDSCMASLAALRSLLIELPTGSNHLTIAELFAKRMMPSPEEIKEKQKVYQARLHFFPPESFKSLGADLTDAKLSL